MASMLARCKSCHAIFSDICAACSLLQKLSPDSCRGAQPELQVLSQLQVCSVGTCSLIAISLAYIAEAQMGLLTCSSLLAGVMLDLNHVHVRMFSSFMFQNSISAVQFGQGVDQVQHMVYIPMCLTAVQQMFRLPHRTCGAAANKQCLLRKET